MGIQSFLREPYNALRRHQRGAYVVYKQERVNEGVPREMVNWCTAG